MICRSNFGAPTRRALLILALITGSGCAGAPVSPDAEQRIEEATGSVAPILFLPEGHPTDLAWPLSDELTLGEAIRRALLSDPRLQAHLARVRVALADSQQVRLLPNPILEIAYRFQTGEVEIGVSAELVSLLTRAGRSRAADDRLRGSAAEAVDQALDIVVTVRSRYATAQAFEELIPRLEERRGLVKRLITVAQDRLDSGEGTRLDVTSLRTQEADLELDLLNLARERRDARLELAHLMGQPSEQAAWAIERRPTTPSLSLGAEAQWIATALKRRPDIEALGWELEALKEEAELAGLTVLEGSSVGLSTEWAEGWSIGPALSIPIPLFDFGKARRARAEAELIEAQHHLIEVRRLAVSEVRRALASSIALQESVKYLRDVVIPLQLQRRGEIETIYIAGQADITTLIIAEQEIRLSQVRLVELEERAAIASAALERAVGGPIAASSVGGELEVQP